MSETLSERDLRVLMSIVEDGRRTVRPRSAVVYGGLGRADECDNVLLPEGDLINGRSWLINGLRVTSEV